MNHENMPRFLYLHGFASSPASTKARAFAGWAERHGLAMDLLDLRVPSFEGLLHSAMLETVFRAIDAAGGSAARVALVGSSLGGLTACRVAAADPRVAAVFAMAPAFDIADRWKTRIGANAWRAWQDTGFLEVDDWATRTKARIHRGFIDELAGLDAELGVFPDVRVPTHLVHGTRDEVVDIALSRSWARGKKHIVLAEVDDTHELPASIPKLLSDADAFFRSFLAGRGE